MLVPMPENGAELCLNIWWFVLEGTDWVDQWAVRAYMLTGTDEEKSSVLRGLAPFDFVNVQWQPIPERYVLVSPDGEEATGVTTLAVVRDDLAFFETEILKHLQESFTHRNYVTTCDSGDPLRFELSTQPVQCDTVVLQTRDGRIKAQVHRRNR